MNTFGGRLVAWFFVVALAGCGRGQATPTSSSPSPSATAAADPATTDQDIMDIAHFAPLERGTYSIDPDEDPATPLRVLYTVAAEGWSQWIGAAKFREGPDGEDRHVGVSIAAVTNLVAHGCHDHDPADPPIGPTVDDLATALAHLAPFQVTAPPSDVTIHGYSGKHLELTVPDMPVEALEDGGTYFTGCFGGDLRSWIAPVLSFAFYGYSGPHHVEEFWILDVEGSRLVIQANWSHGSPRKDIAEMRAVLNSIRIEP